MPLQPPPGAPKNVLRLGILLVVPGGFTLLYHLLFLVSGAYPPVGTLLTDPGALDLPARQGALWQLLSLIQTLLMIPAGIGLLGLRAWGWWLGLAYGLFGLGSTAVVMALAPQGGPAAEQTGPLAFAGLLVLPVIALAILQSPSARQRLLGNPQPTTETPPDDD